MQDLSVFSDAALGEIRRRQLADIRDLSKELARKAERMLEMQVDLRMIDAEMARRQANHQS